MTYQLTIAEQSRNSAVSGRAPVITAHNDPEGQGRTAWEAIALSTTPGVAQYIRPEAAPLYAGRDLGPALIGSVFDHFSSELRDKILATHLRKNFNEEFNQASIAGFLHEPGTTCGAVNVGVCERFIPGCTGAHACDLLAESPSPDSA